METPAKIDLSSLAWRWPSSIVARGEIEKFSGGIINRQTLANLDSAGKGPSGRIRIGRKIAYPVAEVIKWMESRAEAPARS